MDVVLPTAAAFRFYDDDAGEAASTPLANQDTNVTINVDAGNVPFQLRYRIQNAAAVAGAATDDYALQRSHNGGAYATINGTTTAILAAAAGLTNDAASTNRATNGITDGTGSFVAGEQSSDGIVDNWALTASNFTELVWGGTVVAADVSNGQTITFRVSFNGGTPGMTNSVTPTITVQKTSTVAITGTNVVGTGAVGSFGKTVSLALSGNEGTGAVGTVGTNVAYSVAITGEAGTGAVGSLVPSFSLALTGEEGTGAVGTVLAAAQYTVAITGESATGAVGSFAKSLSLALSGVGGTGSEGSLVPSFSLAATGVEGTGAVGDLAKTITVTLGGSEGTGDVGTLAPATGVSVAITGNMGVGYAGDLDVPTAVTQFSQVSMAGDVTQHHGISRPSILNQDSTTKQYRQHDFKPDGVNRESYLIDGELP